MVRTKQTCRGPKAPRGQNQHGSPRTFGFNGKVDRHHIGHSRRSRTKQQTADEERFVETICLLVEGLRDRCCDAEVIKIRKLHTRLQDTRIPVLLLRASRVVQMLDTSNELSQGGTDTAAPSFTFIGRADVPTTTMSVDTTGLDVRHLLVVEDGFSDTTYLINLSSAVGIHHVDHGIPNVVGEPDKGTIECEAYVAFNHLDSNTTIDFGEGLEAEL